MEARLKPLRQFLAVFLIAMASPIAAQAAAISDLDASFLAAFGHEAPLIRQTFTATFMSKVLPGSSGEWPLTVELAPSRLIQLSLSRWALIVKETVVNGDHLMGGAIAVAYLRHPGTRWESEQVWPELLYSGSFGQPANAGDDVKRFGPVPLYLAVGQWCGQDACEDDIDAVSLDPTGPHYLGYINGDARFPVNRADPDAENPYCESYSYRSHITRPTTSGAAFSVTYEGWRALPNKAGSQIRFNQLTNVVIRNGILAMQPAVRFPGCN
jgi:hypothetical protein